MADGLVDRYMEGQRWAQMSELETERRSHRREHKPAVDTCSSTRPSKAAIAIAAHLLDDPGVKAAHALVWHTPWSAKRSGECR